MKKQLFIKPGSLKYYKMNTLIRVLINMLCLLLLLSITSCKLKSISNNNATQVKFKWAASVCAPEYYPAKGVTILYSYQGNKVGGTTYRMVLNQGWEIGCEYQGGETAQDIPDHFYVTWICGTDGIEYEGNFPLPRDSIINLFRKGYNDPDWGNHKGEQARLDSIEGNHQQFSGIEAGLAPGGMVVIWLQPGRANLLEIGRFKAASKGKWYGGSDSNNVQAYKEQSERLANHKTTEMLEIEEYIKHHGIPYKTWEKNEPSYPWGVGLISEDSQFEIETASFLAADGSRLQNQKEKELHFSQWSLPVQLVTLPKLTNAKLPVHVRIEWGVTPYDRSKEYNSEVALPENFSELFLKPYFNQSTGKIDHYNNIIIGVIKGGEEGIIWLNGPNKQVELLRFKAFAVRNTLINKNGSVPSGYAIEIINKK